MAQVRAKCSSSANRSGPIAPNLKHAPFDVECLARRRSSGTRLDFDHHLADRRQGEPSELDVLPSERNADDRHAKRHRQHDMVQG